jgi:hypothetical protein
MFKLDEQTRRLGLKSENVSLEVLKSHLNEDYELNLYALARVLIDSESGDLANYLE